jgi:SAM-dependent methyltransferase
MSGLIIKDYGKGAGYKYANAQSNPAHNYLLPAVIGILNTIKIDKAGDVIFELGCGNGAIANTLSEIGYSIVGVDPSAQGIQLANQHYPHLKLFNGSAYDDLSAQYGNFKIVLSLEVVEHVYFPRKYASTLFDLVAEGGSAIVSTPYHGYLKNLALALSGKMDDHFTALWDYGHIKFWSFKSLRILLEEAGFSDIRFQRVGRIAPLAKSMIAVARKGQ